MDRDSATRPAVERGLSGSLQHSLFQLECSERRKIALQLLWSLPRTDLVEVKEILAKTLQKDIIAALPPEIAVLILVKLPLEDIYNCGLVSHTWAARCNDQALWTWLCKSNSPPIVPAKTTWTDLQTHRVLMHRTVRPRRQSTIEDISDNEDLLMNHDPISSAGGLGGGGGLEASTSPFAPMRRYVYERSRGGFTLPQFTAAPAVSSSRVFTSTVSAPSLRESVAEFPILSHVGTPGPTPQVNHKHLFLAHRKLSRRIRDPHNLMLVGGPPPPGPIKPITLDAVGSCYVGGLPGHREWIYTLSLFHHRMTVPSPPRDDCTDLPGRFDSFMSIKSHAGGSRRVSEMVLQNDSVEGRDWLLSGSRDKTMRLWTIDTDRPRVIKVFDGGHTGSILSLATTILPRSGGASTDGEKLHAISGGSDGRICLWDVEGGKDPVQTVEAHADSVLCVRANQKHVVSCSKDRIIKVYTLPGLKETISVRIEEAAGWGAVNAVGLSDDYIVAGSGDRTIRVWCIRTGAQLACVRAHRRGVAAIHFEPHPPANPRRRTRRSGGIVLGTIATGSSDAAVKIFELVSYPPSSGTDPTTTSDQQSDQGEADSESAGFDGESSSDGDGPDPTIDHVSTSDDPSFRLERLASCRAPCICPPGVSRRGNARICQICLNKGHRQLVRSVCLTPDALLSAGYDGSVRIWDRTSGVALAKLSIGSLGRTFTVVANRLYVASAGADSRITLWNMGQGLDTAFVEP